MNTKCMQKAFKDASNCNADAKIRATANNGLMSVLEARVLSFIYLDFIEGQPFVCLAYMAYIVQPDS